MPIDEHIAPTIIETYRQHSPNEYSLQHFLFFIRFSIVLASVLAFTSRTVKVSIEIERIVAIFLPEITNIGNLRYTSCVHNGNLCTSQTARRPW